MVDLEFREERGGGVRGKSCKTYCFFFSIFFLA